MQKSTMICAYSTELVQMAAEKVKSTQITKKGSTVSVKETN